MRVLALTLLIFSALFSGVENKYPTVGFANSGIKIIDIRTPSEWRETGLYPNSIPITFFDERGGYDVRKFLNNLHKAIGTDRSQKFALICRTGSRTRIVANFLGRNGYSVINLKGGLLHYTKRLGGQTEPYRQAKRYY
jgi:rhodanese-related sulfurtransferase